MNIKALTNEEIIKKLQSSIDKYLKFVAGFGTCFGVFQNNLVILEIIMKLLSLKDKDNLPILICQNLLGGESPLDFSIKARQQKIINLILCVIIKYQDHIIFNALIDKHLCELIKQQIDLQEYFDSKLAIYEILDQSFPSQHHDDREIRVGINLNNQKEIHDKYQYIFGDKVYHSNDQNDSLVSVEYHLINLPVALTESPRDLMKVLSEAERPEYFENQVIQNIINYKWNTYTKLFYQEKFYYYLVFMSTFIIDIFYLTYSNSDNNNQDGSYQNMIDTKSSQMDIWIKILAKIICSIVLFYFLIHEVKQLIVQKRSYFIDAWNYFDFTHIIAFIAYCILDFTDESKDYLILVKILVIILSFMKLFFFLRIFDGFSFLVQMMAGVFKDLKYFIIFFMIFILQFGMMFLVLFKAQQIDEYNGVNKLAYFLMAFRISSGDFQLDDFHNQDDLLVIFTWMIWLIAVMTLNIVFMNFIIAVISESYERVMQKLVAESYRVKANMIVEREQLFSEADLKKEEIFPQFIVVRKQINNSSIDAGEWQGFIKDLKQTIRNTAAKSKGEIINSFQASLGKIDGGMELNKKIICLNENLGDQIQKIKENIETSFRDRESININIISRVETLDGKFEGLNGKVSGVEGKVESIDGKVLALNGKLDLKFQEFDQKVLKLQNDMDFIKETLTQMFQKFNQ
ncbi:wd-40 repeat protein [Stylonychia lemnae]|uniref:Wd-40 repeat protein n=1 Tax=Stylonychia lemnae TaxID=5949 RepID=A0A078A936_STYLE|nr:wd-40 repeat protein [Stylonychia lemnae]|eukprot:CDW78734.1 wd-40 repeat protein [Stylonychia lemnae]